MKQIRIVLTLLPLLLLTACVEDQVMKERERNHTAATNAAYLQGKMDGMLLSDPETMRKLINVNLFSLRQISTNQMELGKMQLEMLRMQGALSLQLFPTNQPVAANTTTTNSATSTKE
jgi:hypothetical protein